MFMILNVVSNYLKKNSKILFRKQKLKKFGFDFEILFLAKKYDFKVKEIGVPWKNDKNSKVKNKDYIITLIELLKVRIYDLFKRYK